MGIARVGHQPGLSLVALLQQVQQLLPCPVQSRGRLVGGFHGVGQIQNQDQCILDLLYGLRNLLQAWSRRRNCGHEPREQSAPEYAPALAPASGAR